MLEILKFAKHYATGGNYIFFSNRNKNSPMSDGTFSKALLRMGYGNDTIVPHGFRAMFSTIANEHSEYGFEVIETQFAHKIGSKVAQVYSRPWKTHFNTDRHILYPPFYHNLKKSR